MPCSPEMAPPSASPASNSERSSAERRSGSGWNTDRWTFPSPAWPQPATHDCDRSARTATSTMNAERLARHDDVDDVVGARRLGHPEGLLPGLDQLHGGRGRQHVDVDGAELAELGGQRLDV